MTIPQNSAQGYRPDGRNEAVQVYVNGEFFPRAEAKVSVFDSGYICGDGVWEGVRLVDGRVVSFDAHIERLFCGARAIALDIGLTREQVKDVIMETFGKNRMSTDAYARLMITRGVKSTPNQDPRFVVGGCSIVCVAEHKAVTSAAKKLGLKLFTSTVRCSSPDVFDMRLNSHSRLNLIQALIQAINAGADEALMLGTDGFVSSCNSTNFFIVCNGELWTSTGRCCFNGITRQNVLRLASENRIVAREKDFTLAEVYCAQEAFVTGTLGGVTPIVGIDGRAFQTGEITLRIDELYRRYAAAQR